MAATAAGQVWSVDVEVGDEIQAGQTVALTVAPTLGAVALAFGISVGIGILFGYLPAKKAAALNPIDALHYD